MRVIKLCSGPGNGVDQACLMTASNMLIGKGELGDKSTCQCDLLRSFIISTNDRMPDDLRSELYGPLVWEIIGTKTDDMNVIRQRAFAFADWAVREIVPIALRAIDQHNAAKELESLSAITDCVSASSASYASYASNAASYASYASNAASYASYAASAVSAASSASYASYASNAASHAASYASNAASNASNAAGHASHAASYASNAASYASYAAGHASYAASYASHAAGAASNTIWRKCPEIILRVAAIGDKRPVERVMTVEQLSKRLCKP